jgi:hypothetical protein
MADPLRACVVEAVIILHPRKAAEAAAYWRRKGSTVHAARIEADLAAQGYCRRCGVRLTDPESIARGIGPDCAKKDGGKR